MLLDDYYDWEGCRNAVHCFLSRANAGEGIHEFPFGEFAYIEVLIASRASFRFGHLPATVCNLTIVTLSNKVSPVTVSGIANLRTTSTTHLSLVHTIGFGSIPFPVGSIAGTSLKAWARDTHSWIIKTLGFW